MALLDNEEVAPLARACQDEIARIARAENVKVSPFATEILTLFVTSAAFEPVTEPSEHYERRIEGQNFFGILMNNLQPIFSDILQSTSVRSRAGETRNLIMTADVYHWLSENSSYFLQGLPCPWAK
jgi:hypothetical protein